ncbi:MAG TPA: alkaline phosphatase family protein [Steroidobacteraceae bacterium]
MMRIWMMGVLAAIAGCTSMVGLAPDPVNEVTTQAAGIRHVFVIVLENKNYADTFETSAQDPYLRKTLVPMGALLTQYYGTGHVSLDNYISLISGQAPTRDTADDCLPGLIGNAGNFNDVVQTGWAAQDQVVATGGCVYSTRVKTLVDQMTQAHLSWRGYMEDMGNDPARERATCGHPAIGVRTDLTNTAEAPSAAVPLGDAYATRHNPFMYFHSIIDAKSCDANVVNLARLPDDLAQARTTPNLVFITPNLCNDGHDGAGTGAAGTTCANGQPGGLASSDDFLRTWVPRILDSPAYRRDGLLIITFDESSFVTPSISRSPTTGQTTQTITYPGETCCHQQPGPNLAGMRPGTLTVVSTPSLVVNLVMQSYGGDRIGAVLLSPFIVPGSSSAKPYNHYSLLRSLEDILRLDGHLGFAADDPHSGYILDSIGNDEAIFQQRH